MDEVIICPKCKSSDKWCIGTSGMRCQCGYWAEHRLIPIFDGTVDKINKKMEIHYYNLLVDERRKTKQSKA